MSERWRTRRGMTDDYTRVEFGIISPGLDAALLVTPPKRNWMSQMIAEIREDGIRIENRRGSEPLVKHFCAHFMHTCRFWQHQSPGRNRHNFFRILVPGGGVEPQGTKYRRILSSQASSEPL